MSNTSMFWCFVFRPFSCSSTCSTSSRLGCDVTVANARKLRAIYDNDRKSDLLDARMLAKLLRVPFFYFAMGSQSNIGGPASAPVVASVFHPSLAPVGALLGALGYATGTVLAYIVGITLRAMAGQA